MSVYEDLVDEFFTRYEYPVIEPFIMGFSGIDPPLKQAEIIIDHELLDNLLGGDSNGHYHLTEEELLKLAEYPDFSQIKHENMPDLLGGDDNGHFHLTREQLDWIIEQMSEKYPPEINPNQVIFAVADSPISNYEISGIDVR